MRRFLIVMAAFLFHPLFSVVSSFAVTLPLTDDTSINHKHPSWRNGQNQHLIIKRRGVAMALDPGAMTGTDNDRAENWCSATNPFGDGDLGSPGVLNSPCSGTP